MPADDIYEVVVEGTLHGSQCLNVYHFKGSNGFSSLAGLIAEVLDCVRTALLPALSVDYKLVAVRGKTIYPALSDEQILAGNAGDVGGVATESDVSFAAALLSMKTGLGGRQNRGRKFIAGIPESGISQSSLTTGELALLATFAACLISKFISGLSVHPYFIGVLRKKMIKTGSTKLAAFQPYVNIVTSSVIATQRRRKKGVGS